MAIFRSSFVASASIALLSTACAQVYLSPEQTILLPESGSASNPLANLGGNSPYFAGPNVNGVTNDVPKGCYVDQVAYVARHGSRYPDNGAYSEWVALYTKIQAAEFKATGSLAFLKSWKPVLTNPTLQIATQSPTGWKEAFDMGYRLRTRYADLYKEGDMFYTWANLYPRVVNTARNFVRGFLGEIAEERGKVITINAKGGAEAAFNSLGPSDQCPAYVDGQGGGFATEWDQIYRPPITARLNSLIKGNLVLTDSDIGIFPYLCGFESQITGLLSPFCSTFTDAELEDYEYRQDLRYYYGSGPGTNLSQTMELPLLNNLMDHLVKGPKQTGTAADGSSFKIPDILTLFQNDGQMTQLVAGAGVFDDQTPLSGTKKPEVWRYRASRFCSMRGTIAFERLACNAGSGPSPTSITVSPTPVPTLKSCNRDNCFRQMLQNSANVSDFCATYTTTTNTATTALPTFVSQCQGLPSRVSSACSCIATSTATPKPATNGKSTYIRILLNDAVYPLPSCQDGPGKSCLLSEYKKYVSNKLDAAGDLVKRCNMAIPGIPEVLPGAKFLRDLRGDYLAQVKP